MRIISGKGYQRDAVDKTLEIFRYANGQLNQVSDEESRANVIAHNGCVLLEAPTGAGKTLMAGMIAEEFSRPDHTDNAKMVWFWFTPFAGLVEQAKNAIRKQFSGLRVRDIQADRKATGTRRGDLFVSTWGSVAASNKQTRKLHRSGDDAVALEEFIPSLRGMGFRIGVVVDEAHHGFTKAREAVSFFCGCLKPEFTLLITATPNDQDVERFKQTTSIQELHRTTVSRHDAVEAGLIKPGVKSVAYLASEDQKALVDFALTALTDALTVHRAIKQSLADQGVNLVPLMLVQVSSSNNSIAESKKKLLSLNVPEDAIAVYKADEPTNDLLAVAMDETKEVLIFKMAVALGFDAPRAFTLVSMRGARDPDFGIQVVGRILRVHRHLQGRAQAKILPELLSHGYVFLADSEQQAGLTGAAERINAIRTEFSTVCPYTIVVKIAGENQVQVARDGQPSFFPLPSNVVLYPSAKDKESSNTSGKVKSIDEIIAEAAQLKVTGTGIEEAVKGLYEKFGGANAETGLAAEDEQKLLVDKLSEFFNEKGIQINPLSDTEASGNTIPLQPGKQTELPGILADFLIPPTGKDSSKVKGGNNAHDTKPMLSGNKTFALKPNNPLIFKTERLPVNTEELLECIGKRVKIDDSTFMEGLREAVNIKRREESLFDGVVEHSTILAHLERGHIAHKAQLVLFEPNDAFLDAKALIATLMQRMRKECEARGMVKTDEELRYALDLISVRHPGMVRWAAKECAATHKELHDTVALPESLELLFSTPTARLNIYGIMPPDLNEDERAFAELLDADLTNTVEWWHRNEPNKPWSIGLYLPNGKQYFPDFVIKVKKRTRGNGLLLAEVKGGHILNDSGTLDKAVAEHKLYKAPLMIVRDRVAGRFMTVKMNERGDKLLQDQVFYVENMAQY
jgi:superfamily II DNA or RNA helicase